jgi:hypothetical protein
MSAKVVGIEQRRFCRPDMLAQPAVEREVVGQAAQQGHGGVPMGVDQPRQDDVMIECDAAGGGVLLLQDGTGPDIVNAVAGDEHGMILEYRQRRVTRRRAGRGGNRYEPAGADQLLGLVVQFGNRSSRERREIIRDSSRCNARRTGGVNRLDGRFCRGSYGALKSFVARCISHACGAGISAVLTTFLCDSLWYHRHLLYRPDLDFPLCSL